jgi:hypothetical protein
VSNYFLKLSKTFKKISQRLLLLLLDSDMTLPIVKERRAGQADPVDSFNFSHKSALVQLNRWKRLEFVDYTCENN